MALNQVKSAIVLNQYGGEIIIRLASSHFAIENTSEKPMIPIDNLF